MRCTGSCWVMTSVAANQCLSMWSMAPCWQKREIGVPEKELKGELRGNGFSGPGDGATRPYLFVIFFP